MKATICCAALIAGLISVAETSAQTQWPQFLGPQRNGISTATGLIDEWPAGGPEVVWRAACGDGMSGIAVDRGRAVTMFQDADYQYVLALDARSGDNLWQTQVAKAFGNSMGDGPRATPAIVGDRVLVFTGEGILAALKWESGEVLWSVATPKELGGKVADYGMASSPLVVGEHVVVAVGAPNAAVAAFHLKTGQIAWTAGKEAAGYSSAALLNVNGQQQIVAFTGSAVLGLDPSNGKVAWRYPFPTDYDCNIATPLSVGGRVFISSGENHGSLLLAIDGNQVKEVWSSLGTKSVMRNEWQTSIQLDGYFYGLDNVGSAGPVTHMTCIKAATGERVWQKTRFGKGNMIAADGKLFASTMKGELVMINATPERYQELGRATLLRSTRQAPALANGHLYLRDDREIICVKVTK